MKPMLDPTRDLSGATPEALVRALFRRVEPLRPRTRGEPVVGDQVAVDEVPADEPSDGVTHLDESSESECCAYQRIRRRSVAGVSG